MRMLTYTYIEKDKEMNENNKALKNQVYAHQNKLRLLLLVH